MLKRVIIAVILVCITMTSLLAKVVQMAKVGNSLGLQPRRQSSELKTADVELVPGIVKLANIGNPLGLQLRRRSSELKTADVEFVPGIVKSADTGNPPDFGYKYRRQPRRGSNSWPAAFLCTFLRA